MTLLKLEHNFSQDIKVSLHSSCRDIVVKNSVNIMCKGGVVSCDPTVLASVSKIWRNILMTTDEDTKYILSPDYNVKFMKSYLLSCIFGSEKQDRTTNFDGKKDGHQIRFKIDSQEEMLETNEKKSDNDEDISKCNSDLVDTIVNEFVEKLVDVCVNDDEKNKYKEGDRKDDYNVRYYFDYQMKKDMPFRLAEYVVMMEGHSRKVRNVMDAYKSLLIETFHVKEETECNICLKRFSRPAHCKAHKENMHSRVNMYQCEKCKTKFKTEKGLRTHLQRSHENESKDPFICTVCGAVFLLKSSLARHCKAKQHNSYPKTGSTTKKKKSRVSSETKCKICHKIIASHALESHMKKDHTEEAREFKCRMCEFETNRNDSLLRHYRERHNRFQTDFDAIKATFKDGISSYQCPDCKKILRTKEDVEDHLVGKICALTCNICNKTFSRKHYLKQHKKSIHKEIENP